MSKPYNQDDLNYIHGFEAGCNFICNEIEQTMRATPGTEAVLAPLLRHLRQNPGKLPIKIFEKSVDKV